MFALSFLRRDLPVLTSNRLILRLPRRSDHADWAALRDKSRDFLEPWEPKWHPDELEAAAWRLRLKRYRADYAAGVAIPFLLFEKAGRRQMVGGITLSGIRRGVSQTGHLGYWMGADFAGKGYMTEAVIAVTQYSFDTLGLHRVEAACIPDNLRSARVLEKSGFTQEGLLRSYLKIDGQWRDHRLFARLASDPALPFQLRSAS